MSFFADILMDKAPGGVLEKAMGEKDMSRHQLSEISGIPIEVINAIIDSNKEVEAETALILTKHLVKNPFYRDPAEREAEIAALEKFKVKACGGDMESTYIGNGLQERLKPFGIEGTLEK